MFYERLKWFCILLLCTALVLIARLMQIQLLHAADYEALSERLVAPSVHYTRAPRGDILDRNGVALVSDEPAADLCVHYRVLIGDADYLRRVVAPAMRAAGRFPRDMSTADIVDVLRGQVRDMWQRLAELSGTPPEAFVERMREQYARVERIRDTVIRNSPAVSRIKEEDRFLPMLDEVDPQLAVVARLELEKYPWVRVVPGAKRVAHAADDLVHVLGRTAAASRERISADPLRDDELARMMPGDRCGVSGIEYLADAALRGRRGRVLTEFDGTEIERTDPIRGQDVFLTIDAALQRKAVAILREAVEDGAYPAGGSIVVMDAQTREVRVLASYPTYSYATFNEDYGDLRDDSRRLPLMFRAVQGQYPPGSTCKAMTLVAGLSTGVIAPSTRFHCTGFMLPEFPTAFRCWIYNQYPGVTHDMESPNGLDAEAAIRNSCNIYFYQTGQRLGAATLCDWFGRFGLGRTAGTGLLEESRAIVPSEGWLQRTQGRLFQQSDAWNFAIGQGEVTITPLQSANVAATIATGYWAPVRLAFDDRGQALSGEPQAEVPLDERALSVLRRGMWRVVNERGGTAHEAQLDATGYELLGKTGSAQAMPRVIRSRYTLAWPDGREEMVLATSREEALRPYASDPPKITDSDVAERFPPLLPGERLPSHAWFIGFSQAKSTPRGGAPQGRVYAIAVLIEYGGSGGKIAGPVAKQMMDEVLAQEN